MIGGAVTACAIGAGASGLVSNGVGASVAMPGLLLLIDASIGTRVLSDLAINQPDERRRVAEAIFFAHPEGSHRYLLAALSGPLMLVFTLTTGVGYATMTALIACVVAYGGFAFWSLWRVWRRAGRPA